MSPRIHGISTKLERNNSFQKNISGAVINYTFTYIFLNSIFHILYLVPSSSNYTKPNRLQIYIFIRVPPYFRILYDIREGDNGEWRCFFAKEKATFVQNRASVYRRKRLFGRRRGSCISFNP